MKDLMLRVEPLIPALRRYARALMPDRDSADDLVQDCLERVISRWRLRRAEGDARAWVFTILHNLAINHLKQKTRRGWHIAIEDAGEAAMARPPSQEDSLRRRDIFRALETLSEDQRSVLLLVSVEELSYADTAQVLGIPVGTVMSRLARAREKLMQIMEGERVVPLSTPTLRRVK
jgi:RNA polymerase sigma factor (sigma-70 family)